LRSELPAVLQKASISGFHLCTQDEISEFVQWCSGCMMRGSSWSFPCTPWWVKAVVG
jgi:hypothetical protein